MFNQIILKCSSDNSPCDLWGLSNEDFNNFIREDKQTFLFENLQDQGLFLRDIEGNTISELSPEEALISALEAGAYLADPVEVEEFFLSFDIDDDGGFEEGEEDY
jgi:hypothetical protein